MIDFTNCPQRNKAYAGANGNKISIVYQGSVYMLKFPPTPTRNKEMSYTNGCLSEYLGCHIYESIGIPVQETLLGTYRRNGKEKVVVACKDFTAHGKVLQDFASLKNSVIDSARNGYGTELSDVLLSIEKQQAIDPELVKERFWDMFIVDALIGNWDRHNGNWGFLYDTFTDELELAPVFDCGSSLYPQADDEIMRKCLAEQRERDLRIFSIPTSSLQQNNKKIRYFDFLSSLQNEDCNQALKRILPRINMEEIQEILQSAPMPDLQKDFLSVMLQERKERLLDFSLTKLVEREQNRKEAPDKPKKMTRAEVMEYMFGDAQRELASMPEPEQTHQQSNELTI